MKICVMGLWHLGSVTAACMASLGYDIVGFDEDIDNISKLSNGLSPLFEPGLDELLNQGIADGKLRFSYSRFDALECVDVVWVAFDTPVDDEDNADAGFVLDQVERSLQYVKDGTIILISSQIPVGSIRKLEGFAIRFVPEKTLSFVCVPENLRLGRSIDLFLHPDRIVIGVRNDRTKLF